MPTSNAYRPLALLLALTACGGAKNTTDASATGEPPGASSSTGGVDVTETTGAPPADPTTGSSPMTSNITSVSSTTGETTIAETTTAVDITTGGGDECQVEAPPPGACDGGKPKPAAPHFAAAAPMAVLGLAGPAPLADPPDDEQFATTGGFIVAPDLGESFECDIFGDDCKPDEKCNAWAEGGGSSWNATKCVPVARDPDPIGAPCSAEGGGVSGIDSCVAGAMCFGIGNDGMGTCVEQCGCSPENPICTTSNTVCSISNDGVLALCLPVCDPFDVATCSPGQVCVMSSGVFTCVTDASGSEGQANDGCQFANACDPGLLCAANNGKCQGAGCCTPFCDLDEPVCEAGLGCISFFGPDNAPKCLDDLGVCFPQ